MYYLKILALFYCFFICFTTDAQSIDSCFKTAFIRNTGNDVHYKSSKKSKIPFIIGKTDIVCNHAGVLTKHNNKWTYSKDKTTFGYVISSDTLDFFEEGSQIISIGFADLRHKRLRGNRFKSVSYRIKSPLIENEMATFNFKILSETSIFCPKVYFSKRLIIRNKHIVNNRSFDFKGTLDTCTKNIIVNTSFNLRVDKQSKKYRWIHIVAPRYDGGFIVSPCNNIKKNSIVDEIVVDSLALVTTLKKPKNEFIYFQNASTFISELEVVKLQEIIKFLKLNTNQKVEISGYAASSGDLTKNMILAKNRMKEIKLLLIEKGIAKDQILDGETGIANFGNEEKNRVCLVKILTIN
jgi:outer membrane protein OmpA-like peptidoglycan-associated protein